MLWIRKNIRKLMSNPADKIVTLFSDYFHNKTVLLNY